MEKDVMVYTTNPDQKDSVTIEQLTLGLAKKQGVNTDLYAFFCPHLSWSEIEKEKESMDNFVSIFN